MNRKLPRLQENTEILDYLLKSFFAKTTNPTDKITVDVPLMIRLLEYAREDAKDDMDLHDVTERLVELSRREDTLSMKHYKKIIG